MARKRSRGLSVFSNDFASSQFYLAHRFELYAFDWRICAVVGSMSESVQKTNYLISPIWAFLLWASLIVGVVFIAVAGVPYLIPGSDSISGFAGREPWIIAHIVAGSIALILGPFQIWLGTTRKAMAYHRTLGYGYLVSVLISSSAAFYLAVTTKNGWMFGMGLFGLGVAWVLSTGLAFAAVLKHEFDQHQEWMIRSYVVTLGFVFFRVFLVASSVLEIGMIGERLVVASWICWAFPLLATEGVIQGRKIFGKA